MTLDVSKITCEQYVQHKVGNPQDLAACISQRIFHGTRKELTVDVKAVETMAEKVEVFCYGASEWSDAGAGGHWEVTSQLIGPRSRKKVVAVS